MGIQEMHRTHRRARSAGRVYECFVLQHTAKMPRLVLAVNPNYDLQPGFSLLAIKTSFGKNRPSCKLRLRSGKSPLYQMPSRSISHEQKIRPVATGL